MCSVLVLWLIFSEQSLWGDGVFMKMTFKIKVDLKLKYTKRFYIYMYIWMYISQTGSTIWPGHCDKFPLPNWEISNFGRSVCLWHCPAKEHRGHSWLGDKGSVIYWKLAGTLPVTYSATGIYYTWSLNQIIHIYFQSFLLATVILSTQYRKWVFFPAVTIPILGPIFIFKEKKKPIPIISGKFRIRTEFLVVDNLSLMLL